MPPPFVTWAEGLSAQMVGEDLFLPSPKFGRKTGLDLSEDLLFLSSTDCGQENVLILGGKNFHSGVRYSPIF